MSLSKFLMLSRIIFKLGHDSNEKQTKSFYISQFFILRRAFNFLHSGFDLVPMI